jgi:subtilisin family serine protease
MQRFLRHALTGAVFALLASCGGGGGSPESTARSAQANGTPAATTAATTKGIFSASSDASLRAGKTYIVQLKEPPVATYDGGINGHAATRPARGSKIDSDSASVTGYRGHLKARQDAVARSAGGAKVVRNYAYVFNGFAARMTEAQALKLAATPGVLTVSEDELRTADTSSTPAFLGLSGRDGFWRENDVKGEGIVIGVIDSGIWPEHPSFSDRKHGDVVYERIRGWKGSCITGEQFAAKDCNRKLIGARYYNEGFGGDAGVNELFPYEFNSPRDYNGHGTHTSSTAGGNEGVPATGPAAVFGKVSGIAPRARIAMYKALWHNTETGTSSGFNSDLVAAIDDAVADGVDVINYSISGSSTNFLDPVELAFLRAADAGVFIAASAGNSGPTVSTVAHPSPWITTVAAGTHNRDGAGSATLGNGVVVSGSSVAAALASKSLINAADAVLPGGDATAARLCFSAADAGAAVLDPAKVAGKIVVCDRGSNARVNKSQAVLQAGGVGMLLLNLSPASLNADLHFVPTVHLPDTVAAAVHAYAATPGAPASIAQATITYTTPAPFTASFSSRGPLRAGAGSLLKPDIIAPGQDILAGVAPPNNNGRLFDVYSGTSMSSPHIAGLAALMKELHPRWSPMAIKSALMTSAGDVLDGPNTHPLVIFRQGAGHVRPNNAADPGLVFDSGFEDWAGFLCGTQLGPDFCTDNGIAVLDPSDLNTPSIAIGALAGTQTVTRKVTNVSGAYATYTAAVTGMAGFQVVVSPASLTLARGQTKSFTVSFTRTGAALKTYTGGQLTLTGGTSRRKADRHEVRIPLVVQPVALAAPAEAGASFGVKFGYTGPFSATPRGLVAAATSAGSVATDAFVDIPVTIPAGATYARFSLFDANVSKPSDLDLEVYDASGELVGSSGSGTSAEEVNLVDPPAGSYTVRVVGFATGDSATAFTLFNWSLGSTSAGNMTVTAPANAVTGGTGTVGLSFAGLAAGTKYLGSVVYGGDPALPAPTIVRVDP